MRAFISLKNSMFCVQGQFPKDSLEEWGWGFGGNLPMGLGQKQLDEMPFFHMQTVAKRLFMPCHDWTTQIPSSLHQHSDLGFVIVSPSGIQKRCWLRRANRV